MDDKHARMLLRGVELDSADVNGKRWTERQISKRRLLDAASELFVRYGLETGAPLGGSNVETWSFRYGSLNVRIWLDTQPVVTGKLREQDHEHGGSVGRELEVTVCELVFDVDDGQYYGRDGRSGIDTLVEGLLRVLKAI